MCFISLLALFFYYYYRVGLVIMSVSSDVVVEGKSQYNYSSPFLLQKNSRFPGFPGKENIFNG